MISKYATYTECKARGGLVLEFANETFHFLAFPKCGTLVSLVLADLLSFHKLSHTIVFERYGSARAGRHICSLRRDGWPVETRMIDAPTRHSRSTRTAMYSLPADFLGAANCEAVWQFIRESRKGLR